MLSSNGNPYLRPEYLNPPPSTMDSKKSPLALLAQTCSQIGSDPVAAGSSNNSAKIAERKKSMESSPINGQQQQQNNNKASPILSVGGSMDLSNKGRSSSASVEDPASSSSKTMKKESRQKETAESRRSKSSSPKDRPRTSLTGSELPPTTPTAATPSAASIPAYNPLMMPTDPMAGYKSLMAAGISPYPSPYYPGYPSGLDLNAYASALKAMPPPPPSAYHPHHHPAAAAAAYSAALALQYSRMNAAAAGLNKPTSSGSEPCRDPYCTGCPNSSPSIHMICPAGCSPLTQCDHPKVPIPAAAAAASNSSPAPQNSKPYVCNWIVADNYCGKRFGSSDDLLQHLRTHTNLASTTSSVDPNHPRAYPTPPLSPLSAARYHPYGKHPSNGVAPGPPPPAAASFFPQGGYNPALFQHPALAPYYSHLSLFAPPRASLPP